MPALQAAPGIAETGGPSNLDSAPSRRTCGSSPPRLLAATAARIATALLIAHSPAVGMATALLIAHSPPAGIAAWPLPGEPAPGPGSAGAGSSAGSSYRSTAVQARRIVAIGDIHGAFEELTAILDEADLIDEELRWDGGDTLLIQTGDFTDRGPEVRRCMDLLMRLQREAPADGGEVVVLLANHEVMNLVSALRDVAPSEYEKFVDTDSARRQDEAFQEWARVRAARARGAGAPEPEINDELRAAWEAQYPLGYSERMEAMGSEGTYGRWLRGLPTAIQRGDILFMHAGIHPDLADRGAEQINDLIGNEIERFDEIKAQMVRRDLITANAKIEEVVAIAHAEIDRLLDEHDVPAGATAPDDVARFIDSLQLIANVERWQLLNPDGYHWFRGFGLWSDADTPRVDEVFAKQSVAHIVVAHVTQPDATIKARFGARVFLIDTGMLAEHYGGRPSALEIVDGTFTAIYLDERVRLHDRSERGP